MTFARFCLLLAFVSWSIAAQAADLPGSKDHPLVSRYQGSEILRYEQRDYDALALIKGHFAQHGGRAKNPDALMNLEGRVTQIAYRVPPDRSVLEVFRNYEQALAANRFATLFACENDACGGPGGNGRSFNEAAIMPNMSVVMGYNEKDQRYLLAKLARPEGDAFVSVYVNRAYSTGGANHNRVFVDLRVVETKPMQQNMVKVDAAAMAKDLDALGHIALYEIYFDTDKADLKPESANALKEIQSLLAAQKDLKVLIVGHTDNVGQLDYNKSLSERRATAVVNALIAQYGIAKTRLTPVGVGMAAPIASNADEAGRAKNRRVELVKW